MNGVAAWIEQRGDADLDSELLPGVRSSQIVVQSQCTDREAADQKRYGTPSFRKEVLPKIAFVGQDAKERHVEGGDDRETADARYRAAMHSARVSRVIKQPVCFREAAQIRREQ